MKKTSLLIVAILIAVSGIWAQTPHQFKYQAVLRDASGVIMATEAVTINISILQGSASGTSVFNETHNVTTTAQGLVNLNIGSVEDLSAVDFGADTYFVKITVNGTIMGTSQLLSVPYALQSKTADNVFSGDYNDLSNQPTLFDGSYNSLSDLPTLFDGQYSSLTGTPTIPMDFSDLTDNSSLLFDGDYNNLTSLPVLNLTNWNTAFGWGNHSGLYRIATWVPAWSDVTAKPNFATVATSGSYTDLSNQPTITDDQTLAEVLTQNNSASNTNITNLADPISDQDAATKAYVDLLESRIEALELAQMRVTDFDGNTYGVVKIDNQVWMAEDLRVTHYPNGDAIPLVTDNTLWANLADDNTTDAYTFYDNDNGTDYGALYSYAAAIGDNWARDYTANQGVCPDGWHLPTDTEWATLIDYLGGVDAAGGKLKEIGTAHWNSPNDGATNETGFTAFPGGYRSNSNGVFYNLGDYGHYWTSTESDATNAYSRLLSYTDSEINRLYYRKSYAFTVRCIRD